LSYLAQYKRLHDKAALGQMTAADFALLQTFDLAELHQFEMARELSIKLLVKWLANYKFKDWTETQTRKLPVTQEHRERRAEEIARKLSDHEHWGSHGRVIHMNVLRDELNLRIHDFGQDPELSRLIRGYFSLATDLMVKTNTIHLVHATNFL
jgi:hypothetical protein